MTHFKIILALVLLLAGCKTAQSQDSDGQALKAGPGLIVIKALIKELPTGPVNHCNQNLENLATVEVLELKEYGAGITRIPQKNTEIFVQFFMGYEKARLAEDVEVPGIKLGMEVEIQLREKSCFGTPDAYYQAFNYQ